MTDYNSFLNFLLRLFAFLIPFQVYFNFSGIPIGTGYLLFLVLLVLAIPYLIRPDSKYRVELIILMFLLCVVSVFSQIPMESFRKCFAFAISTFLYLIVVNIVITRKSYEKLIATLLNSSYIVMIIGLILFLLLTFVPGFKLVWFAVIMRYGNVFYGEAFSTQNFDNVDEINQTFYGRGYEGWFSENAVRNVAVFPMHFEFGFYCILFSLIYLDLFFKKKRRKTNIIFFIIALINLMSTYSRTAYFAGIVTLGAYLLMSPNFSKKLRIRVVTGTLGMILVLAFIPNSPINNIITGLTKTVSQSDDTDLEFRSNNFFDSLEGFAAKPVLGWGRHVFTFITGVQPHYGVIYWLTDTGIVTTGVLIMFIVFYYFVKKGDKNMVYDMMNLSKFVSVLMISGLIFADYFTSHKLVPIFFIVLALIDVQRLRFNSLN